MSRIVNFYNVAPHQLKPGDVLVCTVTLHMRHITDAKGRPTFAMYRCPFPNPQIGDAGIPQGDKMPPSQATKVAAVFPIIEWAELVPEP